VTDNDRLLLIRNLLNEWQNCTTGQPDSMMAAFYQHSAILQILNFQPLASEVLNA
jgi:hypothetical protein